MRCTSRVKSPRLRQINFQPRGLTETAKHFCDEPKLRIFCFGEEEDIICKEKVRYMKSVGGDLYRIPRRRC